MNKIKSFLMNMATKIGTWTDIDDETACLMGELDAQVADLVWPVW